MSHHTKMDNEQNTGVRKNPQKISTTLQLKKGEGYIVLAWLPLSVVLGGVMQILPRELAESYTLVLLPLLLALAVVLVGASVLFRRRSVYRWFLLMLWAYLLFMCLGDLTFSILDVLYTEPPTVGIADFFWLTSSLFLIAGTLSLLYTYRGFRISSKWLGVLCIWFLITSGVMVYTSGVTLGRSSSSWSNIEMLVILSYPVLDAIEIMLLLILCSLYASSRPRFYFLFLIFSICVVTLADTLFAIDPHYYVGCYIDSIYAAGYSMLVLAGYLTLKFTPEDTVEEIREVRTLDKKIQGLILSGTATSTLLCIFFFSFQISHEVIKAWVSGYLLNIAAFIFAVTLSLLFKVVVDKIEKKNVYSGDISRSG